MHTARLIRLEETHHHGTFGALLLNSQLFCTTLEPADLLNRINVSSIPAQQYMCYRFSSEDHPDTFQVMNVPARTGILFHSGNTDDDTAGCILLGQYKEKFGYTKNHRMVYNSGDTFKMFMEVMDGQEKFHLTIKEEY